MCDLFNDILTNSFSDSRETIEWLVNNNYIMYQITLEGCELYLKLKEFEWNGEMFDKHSIMSKYYFSLTLPTGP